jgi:hypothetical protein
VDFRDIPPPERRISLAKLSVATEAHLIADLALTVTVVGPQLLCHLATDRAWTGAGGERVREEVAGPGVSSGSPSGRSPSREI